MPAKPEAKLLRQYVGVRLTMRQYHALRGYSDAVDVPMSAFVRALVVQAIPPPYWEHEEPPAGQMRLGEE